MKTLFLFVVLLSIPKSFPQWSTNPNNNLIIGYGLNPELCSDSAGGCYITYEAGYPEELYLHRIDRYGYQPWGDKRIIAGELEEQSGVKIIEDDEGGVIVSYGDHVLHETYRLRIQKVDSSGNLLWGATGIRVSVVDTGQSVQRLVTDGDGGCVIVWMESNFGTAEYRMNRIDRNGQRVWSDSGLYIMSDNNFDPPSLIRSSDGSYYFQVRENLYKLNENGEIVRRDSVTLGYIVPDSEGGIVLSGRVGNINNRRLVAQRKDSLGNNLWQEPYVEIADSLYITTSLSISQNNGHFYYGWTGKRNGVDKVAQFQALRLSGSKLYLDGSIKVGIPPLNGTVVDPLEQNRTAFIYYNKDFLPDSLLVQTYDTLGNKLWNEDGVLIAHPPIEYQSYTTDGNGGFIIGGTINDFTVVVQQVSKYGNLGEVIPVPVELVSFSSVADKDKIILNWVTATELNNYGFEIQRLLDNKIEVLQDWEAISFVQGFGTTTEPKSYSYTDDLSLTPNLTHILKYRLKQIDYDGSFEYSNEIEINFGQPSKYILEQNYPNPFNSTTSIKYQLPKEGRIRIVIYNVLGEGIKILVDEYKTIGTYSLVFNSYELTSGVYLYTLETGSEVIVKKLTILK